jgi:hypothetical protein
MMADVEQIKRLRGVTLTLVYSRHREQQSRMDHVMLWAMLRKLQHDVGLNDVVTVLQDLKDRGMVTFEQTKDKKTNEVRISLLQITPLGRDLVEETIDPNDYPAITLG